MKESFESFKVLEGCLGGDDLRLIQRKSRKKATLKKQCRLFERYCLCVYCLLH